MATAESRLRGVPSLRGAEVVGVLQDYLNDQIDVLQAGEGFRGAYKSGDVEHYFANPEADKVYPINWLAITRVAKTRRVVSAIIGMASTELLPVPACDLPMADRQYTRLLFPAPKSGESPSAVLDSWTWPDTQASKAVLMRHNSHAEEEIFNDLRRERLSNRVDARGIPLVAVDPAHTEYGVSERLINRSDQGRLLLFSVLVEHAVHGEIAAQAMNAGSESLASAAA
jgi:hypothetical protein